MSNQEAIALLRNLEDSLDSYCELSEEGKTAFRMAIEALSSSEIPNSSDCISRQAAIDALNRECRCGAVIDHCGLETAMDIISELPPTHTERITSRWIPCGERQPENDNDVLVQMNDGSMMVDYRAASSNGWFWAEFDDEPVAWMPLPEPYKGVTDGND